MNSVQNIAIIFCLSVAAAIAAGPPPGVPSSAPPEPDAIPLYPDSKATAASEQWIRFGTDPVVRNVTRPTLTPFLPKGKATGEAVIVAPGGAFMLLAMDHEGWSVARALADRGITAFVLKYRLNETPVDQKEFDAFAGQRFAKIMKLAPTGEMATDITEPRATEDALAAIKMVRANAKKWGVDPTRVGMIGFSAGAMTSLNAALAPNAADRPAFVGLVYPPMKPVTVPADAPPMFAAIAIDDEMFGRQGFSLVESWHKANRPVELHAYERGGHGFGLGRPGTTTTMVLDQFLAWLKMQSTPAAPPR